jgi:hypothetical protein
MAQADVDGSERQELDRTPLLSDAIYLYIKILNIEI